MPKLNENNFNISTYLYQQQLKEIQRAKITNLNVKEKLKIANGYLSYVLVDLMLKKDAVLRIRDIYELKNSNISMFELFSVVNSKIECAWLEKYNVE